MKQVAPSGNEGVSRYRSEGEAFFARIGFGALLIICLALSLFIVFRPFFTSHFDAILADPGDGRFEISMLEHWTRSLHGKADLISPIFFYPEKRVLGYSDTLLGLGVPFAALRSIGIDRYLAFEYVFMCVTAIGFVGMYCLLRGVLRFARSTALIGTFLFIISNMYYIDLVHMHLNFVVIAPWFLVFVARYWDLKNNQPAAARVSICVAALLLALVLYTTFNEGWFVVFCSAACVVCYAICTCIAERNAQPALRMPKEAWGQKWNLLLGGVVFLVALIPFLLLYLPSLHRTGKRGLAETLFFMPRILGVFDVGRDNLVWGQLSARIQDSISPGGIHEHPAGWPLLSVSVFLVTAVHCGVCLWRSRQEKATPQTRTIYVVSAIALTCLTLWTAGVKVGNHAPVWALLWKFAPGAGAIRVPQRINLVLNIGVVIVCMFGLEVLRNRLAGRGRMAYLIPAVLVGALAVEQLNFMPTHLISRTSEARKFSRILPPPKECSAFYISNWSEHASEMLVTQTDAMLVAQQYGIPTLNGYSSWFPGSWGLMTAAKGHVGEEAIGWAREHGVTQGLCALDTNWGTWSQVNAQQYVSSAYLGEPIAEKLADPGFEDGDLAAWAPFQGVHSTVTQGDAHGGKQSMAQIDGVGSAYQDITGLQPGQRYRIAAWVAASPGATAGAQIAVFDPGANVAIFSKTVHPGTSWWLLSDFITASQAGTLRIHLFRTEGSGTIYWDDVSVYLDKASEETISRDN
jgi:hypothetical protein